MELFNIDDEELIDITISLTELDIKMLMRKINYDSKMDWTNQDQVSTMVNKALYYIIENQKIIEGL